LASRGAKLDKYRLKCQLFCDFAQPCRLCRFSLCTANFVAAAAAEKGRGKRILTRNWSTKVGFSFSSSSSSLFFFSSVVYPEMTVAKERKGEDGRRMEREEGTKMRLDS
jgi:hypothetical protein